MHGAVGLIQLVFCFPVMLEGRLPKMMIGCGERYDDDNMPVSCLLLWEILLQMMCCHNWFGSFKSF